MSERYPKLITPEALFKELSSFALERSRSFKTGETDIFTTMHRTANRVEFEDNDAGFVDVAYDKDEIFFTAERLYCEHKKGVPPPSDFTIEHVMTRQIDAFPAHLRHLVERDVVEQYDITEPGDLNESHDVTYVVNRDFDKEITIERAAGYTLYDIDEPIYSISEDVEPAVSEIPLAQEHAVLLVVAPIVHDAISDIGLRVQTGAAFEALLEEGGDELFDSFYDLREADSIMAIRALMHTLKTGRSAPKALCL